MAMKPATLTTGPRPLSGGFRTRVSRAPSSKRSSKPLPKDFLSILDFDGDAFDDVLALASRLKRERRLGRRAPTSQALASQYVALLFDKPSLRTRVTFEIAVRELGGDVIAPPQDGPLGSRESVEDVAHNFERWVSTVVIRTFEQSQLVRFAGAAPRLHVINALTNEEHPCQALADALTLSEAWGSPAGRTLAFVGDGNNVATSLVHASMLAGLTVRVASPRGYELPESVGREAVRVARYGARLEVLSDPVEAVKNADAVYTDVWTSMGQELEREQRRDVFQPYQVNAALMSHATPDALFMHCLPAHRGDEVTDEVMDGPTSVVFDQSENRLHAQKALLLRLAGR